MSPVSALDYCCAATPNIDNAETADFPALLTSCA
jgi:hypothetical protein